MRSTSSLDGGRSPLSLGCTGCYADELVFEIHNCIARDLFTRVDGLVCVYIPHPWRRHGFQPLFKIFRIGVDIQRLRVADFYLDLKYRCVCPFGSAGRHTDEEAREAASNLA